MDRFVQRCKPNPSANGKSHPEDRPTKRPRLAEIKDSDSEDEYSSPASENGDYETPSGVKDQSSDGADDDVVNPSVPQYETAFESALPAVATDKEAIDEYETMRASQVSQDETGVPDDAASRIDKRQWVRGKSSIYVDAFNLALDTVLEDEAHLFDYKEKSVFEQWRGLSYEAQYLLVDRQCPCLVPI